MYVSMLRALLKKSTSKSVDVTHSRARPCMKSKQNGAKLQIVLDYQIHKYLHSSEIEIDYPFGLSTLIFNPIFS